MSGDLRAQQLKQKDLALRKALLSRGASVSDQYDPYKFWNEKYLGPSAASASSHAVGIKETASQWLDRQLYSVRKLAWA